MRIISSKPVAMAEVLSVLEERKKEEEELGYEQANALDAVPTRDSGRHVCGLGQKCGFHRFDNLHSQV